METQTLRIYVLLSQTTALCQCAYYHHTYQSQTNHVYRQSHHVQRWESKTSRKKHAFVTFYCAPAAARVLALKDGPLGSRDGLGDMKVQALQLPAFTAHYLAPKMGKNAKRRARADELIRESAAQTRRLLAEERETEDVLRAEIDFEQACLDRTVEDIGLMDIRAKEIKAKRFKLLCHHQEIQERCAVRHKFLESEQALLDQFQNRVEDLERYMVPAMWPLAFAIDDLAKRRGAEAVEKKNKCSLRCVCPHFTAKCLNILADGVLDTEPAYSSIESAQAQ